MILLPKLRYIFINNSPLNVVRNNAINKANAVFRKNPWTITYNFISNINNGHISTLEHSNSAYDDSNLQIQMSFCELINCDSHIKIVVIDKINDVSITEIIKTPFLLKLIYRVYRRYVLPNRVREYIVE